MDYLGEIVVLGIDSLIFGLCLKNYYYCKNAINAVKNTEFHEVGPSLNKAINDADGKIKYIAIKGAVLPLGKSLRSINNKDVTGVIQKLTLKEHVVARTSAGFWSDQERTVQEVYNKIPFALCNGSYKVEVIDAMAAEVLDMDTISDVFEPKVPTFSDHLWGFFTGVRQRGLQSTEEMLREGSILTGIGELTRPVTKPDTPILQPPVDGTPFFLTTMSVSSLLRRLDDRKRTYRWLCMMFGAIGLIIGGLIVRHYWKDREEERIAKELRDSLAASRKERRQKVRDNDLTENLACVVCRSNPREIILLDCGHVCLCEDCSEGIVGGCPICRAPIKFKYAAYIS